MIENFKKTRKGPILMFVIIALSLNSQVLFATGFRVLCHGIIENNMEGKQSNFELSPNGPSGAYTLHRFGIGYDYNLGGKIPFDWPQSRDLQCLFSSSGTTIFECRGTWVQDGRSKVFVKFNFEPGIEGNSTTRYMLRIRYENIGNYDQGFNDCRGTR